MPGSERPLAGGTGAVTPIQRFGSALNLNVHFHMIFFDGVYLRGGEGARGTRVLIIVWIRRRRLVVDEMCRA